MSPSPLARIERLIDAVNHGLHERRQTAAVALLAALAGQHSFLLGPPGTAKSLLARRISQVFKGARYFECLMNRFSTPDEVFGPVSLQALKQDQYQRKTTGFLPAVEFAFLDEIWKSSPAILNTLLTLINERHFRNGDQLMQAPLKGLIAASNELPEADQGLDALYDRFLVRLLVEPTHEWDNFAKMLTQSEATNQIEIDTADLIDASSHQVWLQQMSDVVISNDSLAVIKRLRDLLQQLPPEQAVYVSDRRWQRAAQLIKASAFCCDRTTSSHHDLLLLRHCLWSTPQQRSTINALVEQAICEIACPTELDLDSAYQQLDSLDGQLNVALFYPEDIYQTREFYPQQHFFGHNGDDEIKERDQFFYIRTQAQHVNDAKPPVYFDFFVHQSQMHSRRPFHPYDPLGPLKEDIQCQFSDAGLMQIRYAEHGNFDTSAFTVKPFKPVVLHRQGELRQPQDQQQVAELRQQISDLQHQFNQALAQVEQYQQQLAGHAPNPFNGSDCNAIVEQAISQQSGDLQLNIMRCDALLALGQ